MQKLSIHIYEKSLSILTLFSGETVRLDVDHLSNPNYLQEVKKQALINGLIKEPDFVVEWDI